MESSSSEWTAESSENRNMSSIDNHADKDCLQDTTNNNNKDKRNRNLLLQQDVQMAISENGKQKIQSILDQVNGLGHLEKLLLYLKLPTEQSGNVDPLRQSLNPLGSRSEISQTINWIQTHLEEDKELSLQKKGVYDDYVAFCEPNGIKPLSTADFGKVMKQVYPNVRPRRLGTRGQSKYCYSGLRSRVKLGPPILPDLSEKLSTSETQQLSHCNLQNELLEAACFVIKEWAEVKLAVPFKNIISLAFYLVKKLDVGIGTEAASVLISKSSKVDENPHGFFNKQKESSVQLQKKIQQANQTKRKQNQSPRNDSKGVRVKKQKPVGVFSNSSSTSPVSAANETNNIKSSPQSQEHSSLVCDSANLQTLPDFNSFQRPASTATTNTSNNTAEFIKDPLLMRPNALGKVPIPRITNQEKPPLLPQQQQQQQQLKKKFGKYKVIQPKPKKEQCDQINELEAYWKVQTAPPLAAGIVEDLTRSQDKVNNNSKVHHHQSNIKKKEPSPPFLTNEESTSYFSRERLESISQVEKDALDEYLGASTSNQQEQEEEIIQYLREDGCPNEEEKLLQIRQILAQNNVNYNGLPMMDPSKHNAKMALKDLAAKRRVSFERPEDATNTKFIPIGRLSPTALEQQSLCSSTNASPFVSPRNTPISRPRGSLLPYANNNASRQSQSLLKSNPKSGKRKQGKPKPPQLELSLKQNKCNDYYKMSAAPLSEPCSPVVGTYHLYNKYPSSLKRPVHDSLSSEPSTPELCNMNADPLMAAHYRSQSVPVNAEHENPYQAFSFRDNDLMNLNETITGFNSLEFSDNINKTNGNLPIQQPFPDYGAVKLPSRSVPTTPYPFQTATANPLEPRACTHPAAMISNSKSYPSTPVTLSETFTYSQGHDYLLNGQPIKEKTETLQPFAAVREPEDASTQQVVESIFDSYGDPELLDAKGFNFDDTPLVLDNGTASCNEENASKQIILNSGDGANGVDLF